ncbi:TPM domain-containing protein [Schlesneria paludicola]|uniref:TPM domain-containing protein n=1 Tax=Schlesneria paludicola TaxID=360056 RepID=UPI00029B47FD|nr:TPM domain-containing protein [Schlesneria paludicola]
MLGQRLGSMWKAAFVGCAMLIAPMVVCAADISDEAGFFSAAAIEKANTSIREIEKKSGHDIRIETHATVPKDQIDAVAKMDHTERQVFMDRWVHERAKAVKETGSLVLICKDPARIETWFSGRLANSGMTKADRQRVIDAAVSGMKSKDFDAALNDTVSKLGEVYAKLSPASRLRSDAGHREPLPPTTSSTPAREAGPIHHAAPIKQVNSMGWIYVVGIVIAAIFAIRMLSGLFGSRGSGYPGGPGQPGMGGYPPGGYPPGGGYGQPGYGGGGGGFMRSAAGGLFGAVAGNWLYNAFGGQSAHAQGPMADGSDPLRGSRTLGGGDQPPGNSGWTDDGSSSGGGWYDNGDSGGGGDFGGGDSGGGDSGGDSGGGDF